MTHAETAEEIFDQLAKSPPTTLYSESTSGAHTPYVLERVLGLTGAVCLTFFCMNVKGADTRFLLEFTPYALVLSIVLGGLMASHGPHHMSRMIGVSFGRKPSSTAEASVLRNLCQRGRRLCYVGAMLQVIASTVFFLTALDDLRLAQAVCEILAAFVFAMLLGELGFGSAEHWIERKDSLL